MTCLVFDTVTAAGVKTGAFAFTLFSFQSAVASFLGLPFLPLPILLQIGNTGTTVGFWVHYDYLAHFLCVMPDPMMSTASPRPHHAADRSLREEGWFVFQFLSVFVC